MKDGLLKTRVAVGIRILLVIVGILVDGKALDGLVGVNKVLRGIQIPHSVHGAGKAARSVVNLDCRGVLPHRAAEDVFVVENRVRHGYVPE